MYWVWCFVSSRFCTGINCQSFFLPAHMLKCGSAGWLAFCASYQLRKAYLVLVTSPCTFVPSAIRSIIMTKIIFSQKSTKQDREAHEVVHRSGKVWYGMYVTYGTVLLLLPFCDGGGPVSSLFPFRCGIVVTEVLVVCPVWSPTFLRPSVQEQFYSTLPLSMRCAFRRVTVTSLSCFFVLLYYPANKYVGERLEGTEIIIQWRNTKVQWLGTCGMWIEKDGSS